MSIQVIGAGYVGLITAMTIAKIQNTPVHIVEKEDQKFKRLQQGIMPFFEPGCEDLLKELLSEGLIHFSKELQSTNANSLTFICVGTPSGEDGQCDLSFVEQALDEISVNLKSSPFHHTIAIKSTVVPGTTEKLRQQFSSIDSIGLAMVPEFLREGCALDDGLKPDRIVIGSNSKIDHHAVADAFSNFGAPVIACTPTEAELSKYANNSLLAMLISFSNEISMISEELGYCDIHKVLSSVLADKRWGQDETTPVRSYLAPGCGYGGSCFPKDVKALSRLSHSLKLDTPLIHNTITTNKNIKLQVAQWMITQLQGITSEKKVTLLGLSFKPQTSDTRESPTIDAALLLAKNNIEVAIHDPVANLPLELQVNEKITLHRSIDASLEGSHLCALMTSWPEYLNLQEQKIAQLMARPYFMDGRGYLRQQSFRDIPYKIYGVAMESGL